MLEWRQLFRRGVPISIAIKSKLEAMVERVEVLYMCNDTYCFVLEVYPFITLCLLNIFFIG
jgi:hypothetical protein